MYYIVSIIFLILLTKNLNPQFNTFLSIFTLPKLFCCFAPFTLFADNRITYFLVLGEMSDEESGLCGQMKKIVNFQLLLSIRLTSEVLYRFFCLSFFNFVTFFSTRYFLSLYFWHFKVAFPMAFEKADSHFMSSFVVKFLLFEIWSRSYHSLPTGGSLILRNIKFFCWNFVIV